MAKRNARQSREAALPHGQRAVIYARVSSKEQEREGYSIAAQLKLLREYAANRGLMVVREFVDVETAKQAGRAEFGRMLALLEGDPDCRIVLAEKTDRLYRNIKDWVVLDELSLELHFVKENFIYSEASRSTEKFMHGIKVLMAKNYVDNLGEETKKGQREKARQGLWPSFAPYGYTNVMRDGRRVIEPDPAVAPLIARLFECCATGQYSLKDLSHMMRHDGLRSRKTGRTVPKSAIHRILRNPIYCGRFWWDGEQYDGTHEPIVSRDLWQGAQNALDARSTQRRRRRKHDFAFSGLLACGHCGCALVGELKKGKYVYYHCTGHKGKCGEPYVRQEVLEESFGKVLAGLEFPDAVVLWVTTALRASHADEKRYHDEAVARLRGRHQRLQDRLDKIYIDKLDGVIDQEFYDRASKEWREELRAIARDLLRHQSANETYLEDGARILELARTAYRRFMEQPAQEKRRLLDHLVSNCTWRDGQLHAEFRKPFDMLAVAAAQHRSRKAAGTLPDGLSDIWLLR